MMFDRRVDRRPTTRPPKACTLWAIARLRYRPSRTEGDAMRWKRLLPFLAIAALSGGILLAPIWWRWTTLTPPRRQSILDFVEATPWADSIQVTCQSGAFFPRFGATLEAGYGLSLIAAVALFVLLLSYGEREREKARDRRSYWEKQTPS